MQKNLYLYYRHNPEVDRVIPGDHYIRPIFRRLIRGNRISGVEKVFINLCKGFDLLKVPYKINIPFDRISNDDAVVVLGRDKHCMKGYNQKNPVIAGIGLMTHPSEWPDLCKEYPVVKYLQHSEWANNVYKPYFGEDVCTTWPSGIDTSRWTPTKSSKVNDILIYIKFHWHKDEKATNLLNPIIQFLESYNLSYETITYGSYKEKDYLKLLNNSKAMIFLSEHESQGFACCEALSMDVPVLAWNQGLCLDPNRFSWGDPVIPATSIPFFDSKCGESFQNITEFKSVFDTFWKNIGSGKYDPRKYILENLTLEKSAQRMLQIIDQVYM